MRRLMLLLPFAFACAKEAPKTDAAAPPAAPPAPAAITEADIAGTWKGTSTPVGSDTTKVNWTQICGAGACKGVIDGTKDTVMSTYTMAGDSAIGVTTPYMMTGVKGKVIDHWVVHISNGSGTGTGHTNLEAKPDSVVMTYHFTGTRGTP